MQQKEITGRIVEIEMILQNAVWNGHKCSMNDKFQPLRIERDLLRCIHFGSDSVFCKKELIR